MQSENRFFDDIARVASGAMGAFAGLRTEIEALVKQRFERLLADMDLVKREEFDAVKAMAARARSEQEDLALRVAELEAKMRHLETRLGEAPGTSPGAPPGTPPTGPRIAPDSGPDTSPRTGAAE
jgi:BMFP domain-containing protein YqiC